MIVIWTPEAEQDSVDIWAYIAIDNPSAAAEMDARFSEAIALLAAHPKMGKAGEIAGTRELIPHASYRLVYEIEREVLWVCWYWPWCTRPGNGRQCRVTVNEMAT